MVTMHPIRQHVARESEGLGVIHKWCGFWDRRQVAVVAIGGPVEQILMLRIVCSLFCWRHRAGENRVPGVVAPFHTTFPMFLSG